MKGIALLLALIGSVCSLQYPVEYHYQYEGRAATGIPAIRAQVAAVGIKAKLILQMKTKSQGLAKLTNIKVGDFNGDLQCVQLRGPTPIQYQTNDELSKKLGQPFAVYFQEDMGDVMKVPQSDVEYITNLRKSIVEMLRLEPIVANLGGIKGDRLAKFVSGGKAPDAFTVEEETIFGRCQSQYTISRDHQSQEKALAEEHIKKDDQRRDAARSGSQGVPKLTEQYYRLVRAVDFDKCQDIVIVQRAGVANMSTAGNAQFDSVQSRSSVGSYIIKGQPGAFRVERAVVEGDVNANPFGYKTQRMQTITNQTLVLETAQAIQTPMSLPSQAKNVRTWRYEVASPFQPPHGQPRPWINYQSKGDRYSPLSAQSLQGKQISQAQAQKYKASLLQQLDSAASKLGASPASPSSPAPSRKCTQNSIATTQLKAVEQIMHYLPLQTVREVFQQVSQQKDEQGQRKQMLLADAAAASGAAAPVKVLLEQMKSGQISHERSGSILTTLPSNLMAPSVIPDIMEYVKSLDIQQNPILTSTALVNFASIAERLCINHKKLNYSAPNQVYGQQACSPSQITNDFLPYLKQKAQSASKSWERAVALQAIANLGTPQALPILKPYIYGHIDPNPRVRAVAIYGLTKRRLPSSAREQVFDTLMEVIYNSEEKTEIRQAAFSTLLTWQPDAAWWQQMARQTWREESQSMAAYITFTVQSMAQATEPHLTAQSRIAAFVLPLLKPYSPSQKYSFNYIFSRYDPIQKVGLRADVTAINSPHEAIPSEMYAALTENFGDLHLDMFEVSVASEGMTKSVYKLLRRLLQEPASSEGGSFAHRSPKDPANRALHDMVSQTVKRFARVKDSQSQQEANVYIRAFENMYQYLPLNSEVVSKVAGPGGKDILAKLVRGMQTRATKYANPIDLQYFMPTEIGLPLVSSVSMPSVSVGDAHVQLQVEGQQQPTFYDLLHAKKANLKFSSNAKFASKLMVKMQVLIPWENKMAESGIENYKEANVPAQGKLSLDHTSEVKSLTLNIAPSQQQQQQPFPVVLAHNIPYTDVRPTDPSQEAGSTYQIIGAQKSRSPSEQSHQKVGDKTTGLKLDFEYQADVPSPFTTASFATQEAITPARAGELFSSPTAKQYQFYISLAPNAADTKEVKFELAYLTPQQSSQSRRSSNQMPDLSPQDSDSQRVNKLRSLSEGSQVYAVSAQASFEGSQSRKYGAVAAVTKQQPQSSSSNSKQYKAFAALLASRIPDYTSSANVICAQAEYITPKITSLAALKQAIQSQAQSSVRAQVNHGTSCQSQASQIASASAQMNVSPKRQAQIADELQKICNYDPMNPVVELQTPVVYDQAQAQIQYSKEQIPKSLLNLTYSAQQAIEGSMFPKGSFDNTRRGTPNQITIRAKSDIGSKSYNVEAHLPEKSANFLQVNVPYCLTRIVPYTGLQTSFSKSSTLLISTQSSSTCTIQNSRLTTFDGLTYPYSPLHCYTSASVDAATQSEFVLQTRKTQSGEFEVKIVLTSDSATVVATPSQATINGQPMPAGETKHVVRNAAGEPIMEVARHSASFEVNVDGKMDVTVEQSQIRIMPVNSQRGQFRGVCGDFNGEKAQDQTGPTGCLFAGYDELFKYAWSVPEGDGCDRATYDEKEQEVHDFQEGCSRRRSQQRSASEMRALYETKLNSCYQHVYPVQKDGPALCASKQAVQRCTKQCRMHKRIPSSPSAKCWLSKNVPPEVKDAESEGYLTHAAAEPAKYSDTMNTFQATECRPN